MCHYLCCCLTRNLPFLHTPTHARLLCAQNIFIAEDGGIKLIDNERAFYENDWYAGVWRSVDTNDCYAGVKRGYDGKGW